MSGRPDDESVAEREGIVDPQDAVLEQIERAAEHDDLQSETSRPEGG